jgi:hypothetical protein
MLEINEMNDTDRPRYHSAKEMERLEEFETRLDQSHAANGILSILLMGCILCLVKKWIKEARLRSHMALIKPMINSIAVRL